MKGIKVGSIMILGVVGIILCVATQSWGTAGFAPAPGDECCIVKKAGAGSVALKGTVAVEIELINPDENIGDPNGDEYFNLDAIVRLELNNKAYFFRLNIPVDIELKNSLSDPAILCLILNPLESADDGGWGSVARPKVMAFVNSILTTLFPGVYDSGPGQPWTKARLVITEKSVSDAMGVFQCVDPNNSAGNFDLCRMGDTNQYGSVGDVKIHVVETGKVKFLYPETCAAQE